MRLLATSFVLAALPATAFAQQPRVAIAAAASGSLTDCRYTDTQSRLLMTMRFAAVDIIDVEAATPTLADLTAYDAIVTWSNVNYFDSTALGDVFADYVDAGGGVVVAVFTNASTSSLRSLQGRWQGTYEVIEDQLDRTIGTATLGNVLQPGHPLMAGVNSFDGGSSSFRPTTTMLVPGASVVAEWSDGLILAAVGPIAGRVDLGFYPPSDACSTSFWDSTTDGTVLLANALEFAAGGSVGGIGTNYCMANANSTGAIAAMSAAGSLDAATNDVTLAGSNLPAFSFAFFITSQSQGFVPNPAGSEGNLCLAGAIGRYVGPGQIQQSGMGGTISLAIDLTQTPQPNGFVSVMSGETWNYQAWFRDSVGGVATSNFTDGLEIQYL